MNALEYTHRSLHPEPIELKQARESYHEALADAEDAARMLREAHRHRDERRAALCEASRNLARVESAHKERA